VTDPLDGFDWSAQTVLASFYGGSGCNGEGSVLGVSDCGGSPVLGTTWVQCGPCDAIVGGAFLVAIDSVLLASPATFARCDGAACDEG
jgi:hypothetical protein